MSNTAVEIRLYRSLQEIRQEDWDQLACYGAPQMQYDLLLVVDRLFAREQNLYYLWVERDGKPAAISFWILQTVSIRGFLQRYDFKLLKNIVPDFKFSYLECRVPFSSANGLILHPELGEAEQMEVVQQIVQFIENNEQVIRANFIMFAKNTAEFARLLAPLSKRGYQRMVQYDTYYLNLRNYQDGQTYFRDKHNGKFVKEMGRYQRKLEQMNIQSRQGTIAEETPEAVYEVVKNTMGKYNKEPIPLEYWKYLAESKSLLVRTHKFYTEERILRLEVFFINQVTGRAVGTFTGASYPGVQGVNLYDLCNFETTDWLCRNGFTEYVLGPGSGSLKQKYRPEAWQMYAFVKVSNPILRLIIRPLQRMFSKYNQWKQKRE